MLFVKVTVLTDIGKKRTLNEDRVIYLEHHSKVKLAVLADGMGGHNAGDVASEMAIQYFQQAFLSAEESTFESSELSQSWLTEHVSRLNYNMYQHPLKQRNHLILPTSVFEESPTSFYSSVYSLRTGRTRLHRSQSYKRTLTLT